MYVVDVAVMYIMQQKHVINILIVCISGQESGLNFISVCFCEAVYRYEGRFFQQGNKGEL